MEDRYHQPHLPFESFVSELQLVLPHVAEEVSANAADITAKHLIDSTGALTDTILKHDRRANESELQVLATYAREQAANAVDRREFFHRFLSATNTLLSAATLGTTYAVYRRQEKREESKVNPNLVLDIVHSLHKRARLRTLHSQLVGSQPNEAFLIESVFDHGAGFNRVHNNLDRLTSLRRNGTIDPTVTAFLARKLAVDHRYLGLTKQARELLADVDVRSVEDQLVKWLIVDTRYASLLPVYVEARLCGRKKDFAEDLRADCRSLLGYDPALHGDGDSHAILESQSSDALGPTGLYYRWLFFSAADEEEAIGALERTLALSRCLIEAAARDEDLGDYVERQAWWHLANLLPYAYQRGFERAATRIVAACEGPASEGGIYPDERMAAFHHRERQELRSPVYLGYLLIRALQEYERTKAITYFVEAFKPPRRHLYIRHAVLARCIASVSELMGIPDRDAALFAALPAVDAGQILIQCVAKAHQGSSGNF